MEGGFGVGRESSGLHQPRKDCRHNDGRKSAVRPAPRLSRRTDRPPLGGRRPGPASIRPPRPLRALLPAHGDVSAQRRGAMPLQCRSKASSKSPGVPHASDVLERERSRRRVAGAPRRLRGPVPAPAVLQQSRRARPAPWGASRARRPDAAAEDRPRAAFTITGWRATPGAGACAAGGTCRRLRRRSAPRWWDGPATRRAACSGGSSSRRSSIPRPGARRR